MIMLTMIRLRWGTVVQLAGSRGGATELLAEVDGETRRAMAYPSLVGPVVPGDRILLNTTAVWLGLGTGGFDFVVAVDSAAAVGEEESPGRTMKLRYTPLQVAVGAIEEQDSPTHAAMRDAAALDGMPVVWVPLHSMIAPAVAGARAAGAEHVAHVMTDGAALPAAFSGVLAGLRKAGLVESIVTSGQAFGGDLEAVNVFSGLLGARHVAGADVAVVCDGPGNTGTGTTWGATDVASAMALNAAAILGGRAVAGLRISFVDPRVRHQTVSHHSLTALGKVVTHPAHVAVPALADEDQRTRVWAALREAGLEDRHQLVEAAGEPAMDLLAEHGIEPMSMGRSFGDDPAFFLAAGAAGVLAGSMARGDRAWKE